MKKKVINWKRNNILILILGTFILALPFILFGFSSKSTNISGEDAFKKYILNPIPSGVTNIDADITEYQGSNIYISFTVDNYSTFQSIFNTSKYKMVNCSESEFLKSFTTKKLKDWNSSIGSFDCYEGGSDNFINKTLFFNKYTRDVIYNEIQI